MRRVARIHLIALWLAVPAAAGAQSQASPDGTEATGSLFDETPNQFEIAGRFSDVDGDPARWQRYQDLRDGLLFTKARYTRSDPGEHWFFNAAADNVGWRDQRYSARYERTGKFLVTGLWDQIPQFYSVDTKTPYTPAPSPLRLDDATQRAIQNGQANLNAYVPLAPQFDLTERRDIGNVSFSATPTPALDISGTFNTTRHVGELPWGASFGFSNDVEVALPYNSRTNDFTLGTEWTNTRSMVRVAYSGSWFNNHDGTLTWDSPLRLDDNFDAGPGRGQMSLWPTNSAQTVSAAGYTKLGRRSQVTAAISYGLWSNDEPLQPFTINTTLPQIPLPRSSAQAEANVFSTNVGLTSRPMPNLHFNARLRYYGYDNQTPPTAISDYVSYDDAVSQSPTGGPRRYAHNRTNFDADATWTGLPAFALTAGYSRNNGGYDYRIFESTGEDVLRLVADTVGSQWITFRAQYELSGRSGDGLDESLLTQSGEQAVMRHYDVANRTRNRITGQVDIVPNDVWMFSVSGGVGTDDFDDSYFGLQESTFRTVSVAADYQRPDGLGAGASYNYERYSGLQQSRSAGNAPEPTDPLRDWTADTTEDVHYFSIYATPPRFSENTEARVSYDFSYAEGRYLYAVAPGGPLATPSQLPNVFNKLQQLHVDVRHRLSNRLAVTGSYLYEPFRVFDFAFDPSVVNGIVQPSSLVLGYVYRPYTANSLVIGLKYFW